MDTQQAFKIDLFHAAVIFYTKSSTLMKCMATRLKSTTNFTRFCSNTDNNLIIYGSKVYFH